MHRLAQREEEPQEHSAPPHKPSLSQDSPRQQELPPSRRRNPRANKSLQGHCHCPVMHPVSSMETKLAEHVHCWIEEETSHQKLGKELEEEISHISPEQPGVSAIRSRCPSARERGYTPQGKPWFFLQEQRMENPPPPQQPRWVN